MVLRAVPQASNRARAWRFHPSQELEELEDGGLRIRFVSGGMRELAEHLFAWGGDLRIEGPDLLIEVMNERLDAARSIAMGVPAGPATISDVAAN